MKIALAQINSRLGDFSFNSQKILSYINEAEKKSADLIVFPELALIGYPPNDLLERPEIITKQNKFLNQIVKQSSKKTQALIGFVHKENKMLFNAAALIANGKIKKIFKKQLLPSYDVFDEERHFHPGDMNQNFFTFKKKKILVTICEDLWGENYVRYKKTNPIQNLKQKPDTIISLNASPYFKNKYKVRENLIKQVAKKFSCPVYYINQIGGQDELIFDGQSFAVDKSGKRSLKLPAFKEDLCLLNEKRKIKKPNLEQALILGISDYFKKTGFKKAHLGLSGGIDSALVLYLASKALGPENVTGIAMPGPHSSKLSLKLAQEISNNLSTNFEVLDINSSYKEFVKNFENSFGKADFGLMNENLQARLRSIGLMAFSNRENSLLLATSNKSELTVGYSTLYGDQCGALMPIGDLLKTEVFKLCKDINEFAGENLIPRKIIERPPTAELRTNQKDSDSLPDYVDLDKSIERMITKMKAPKSDLDRWVLNKSFQSEFKRWQSAPILKVSEHAFGRGRRMPIAQSFKV